MRQMTMASSSNTSGQPTASLPGLFPEAERVLYRNNPLTQVICQLRFPTILRVETELPATFQDAVREVFPLYKGPEVDSEVALRIPGDVKELLRVAGALQKKQPYSFSTADGLSTITLAKEFVALSATGYRRWEQFRRNLELAISALEHVYQPAHYSRIGLRYRNVIQRSALGVANEPWQELLRIQLTGELAVPEIANFIERATKQTVIRLPRFSGKVQIRHGLAEEQGEVAYVLDNDFFVEGQTERPDVLSVLQYFSAEANRLFRWCISDRLHEAMGPESLG
jgi:uncharacterized protein (TIGR04255 family)